MRITTDFPSVRFTAACAGVALACFLFSRVHAADAPAVSAGDQVQFQQKTIEAQMQELQDRMYRLAALTRETEPDDAARLVMAVRKAREDLIIEQMRDVLGQLARADLSKASEEQEQVLRKLEELKKLLTSTDLDLQMQLERLRALTAAIAKLDAATKEEQRQRDQADALAKTADAKKLPGPQQEQKQNRQTTESIVETVKNLGAGPAKAGATLGGACQSMSLAEGQFGAGRPGDAAPLQSDAVATMQKAREQLEAERQKALDELQSQVRKQVVENLTEMLERQRSVRGATQALVGRMPSGEEETAQRVRQLAPAENAIIRICDQTSELITEADFSVALPPALKLVRAYCSSVSDQLQAGVANAALVEREQHIEQDLQDLLDTFKQLASEPGPPSQCRGCKGNKNKLLAELKVLRMMQARVNDRTVHADADRAAQPQPSPESISTIAAIRNSQAEIETATRKIQAELSEGNP